MFREGLSGCLESEPDFQVVGQFSSCAEALATIRGSKATIVLLAVNPGGERASDLVLASRNSGFMGKFLIMTAGITRQEAVLLVQAGVSGIPHKHRSIKELCQAIRRVAAGDAYVQPAYRDAGYRPPDQTEKKGMARLTDRDRIVLRLLVENLNNREISERLKITENGVKSSLHQLFHKMGVRNRVQLVRLALEKYRDGL
jgi:two-component system nitrate/nitrite response regulator NarL